MPTKTDILISTVATLLIIVTFSRITQSNDAEALQIEQENVISQTAVSMQQDLSSSMVGKSLNQTEPRNNQHLSSELHPDKAQDLQAQLESDPENTDDSESEDKIESQQEEMAPFDQELRSQSESEEHVTGEVEAPRLIIDFTPTEMEKLVQVGSAGYLLEFNDGTWFHLVGNLRNPKSMTSFSERYTTPRSFLVPLNATKRIQRMIGEKYYEYDASKFVCWLVFSARFDQNVLRCQQAYANRTGVALKHIESTNATIDFVGGRPEITVSGHKRTGAKNPTKDVSSEVTRRKSS